jgi:CHAT domain-containing protein
MGNEARRLFDELRESQPRTAYVSGARLDLYLGAEASRGNLERDLRGYRILHLAVHGFFDEQFPWYSGLVVSGSSDEARVFNLVDIAGLRLDAELVFLSACETARGRMRGCDGIRSTARAFLLAGAESVVATQWPVFDDAAAVVARAFYERLFQELSPAEALREAKLGLLPHEASPHRIGTRSIREIAVPTPHRFAHPSFWAPFILWGV